MYMPDSIVQFWHDNSSNIIISFISGLIFFVLGPLGLWFSRKRVKQERTRKAKEILLDIVEGILVNQENVTQQKLSVLFRAVERETDVDLGESYDIDRLLEDLILRFEKSKHLDATQKDKYSNEVQRIAAEAITQAAEPDKKPIPRAYRSILSELNESLHSNNNAKAIELTEELEQRLTTKTDEPLPFPFNVFSIYRRIYKRNPIAFVIGVILTIIIYVIFINWILSRDLFPKPISAPNPPVSEKAVQSDYDMKLDG
jgi:uncharacterized protein YneF (UPF0154 family)